MQFMAVKRFRFSYGHYLPDYEGPCKWQHGHNAILKVGVSGDPITPEKKHYGGMISDFSDIKAIVVERVLRFVDHRNLNDLKKFTGRCPRTKAWNRMVDIPTAENLVGWIKESLEEIYGDHLVLVRLWETDNSYVEWRR